MNVSQSKNSSKSQSKKKKNPVPSSEPVEKMNDEEPPAEIPINYEVVQQVEEEKKDDVEGPQINAAPISQNMEIMADQLRDSILELQKLKDQNYVDEIENDGELIDEDAVDKRASF